MTKIKKRKPTKPSTKHCGRCDKNRKAKFFGSNAARPTGLADWCKDCYSDWRRERTEEAA